MKKRQISNTGTQVPTLEVDQKQIQVTHNNRPLPKLLVFDPPLLQVQLHSCQYVLGTEGMTLLL